MAAERKDLNALAESVSPRCNRNIHGGETRNKPWNTSTVRELARCAGFPRTRNITQAVRPSSRMTGITRRISESALIFLAWTFNKCFAHSVL
jgi:hypothetical protein